MLFYSGVKKADGSNSSESNDWFVSRSLPNVMGS